MISQASPVASPLSGRAPHLAMPPPGLHPKPFIPTPGRYSCELGTCGQSLHQCSLILAQQPQSCRSVGSNIAFIMSRLSGSASVWDLVVSQQVSPVTRTYSLMRCQRFLIIRAGVGRPVIVLSICQGSSPVSQYAMDFCILAAESGCGKSAFLAVCDKTSLEDHFGHLS